MRIVICDITGRTFNYDWALYEALCGKKNKDDIIQLWSPKCVETRAKFSSFFSLVPIKYRNSSNLLFRILKVIDTLFAYLTICFRMLRNKPEVFHLQWFPFISLGAKGASIDMFFIRLIKKMSPRTKYLFTIHNICPHGMKEDDREKYNPLFFKALSLFDHFVVHTERTKMDVCNDLHLQNEKVSVIYHGVFKPEGVLFKTVDLNKDTINVIMYGNQNWYKGTDILVKSLRYLNDLAKKKLNLTICGAISDSYLAECKSYENGFPINWVPRFLDDDELYAYINRADIIVLPYRRISQSGVLLLALSTNRYIVASNLPNFKETLMGFPEDMFFQSEDPKDLARVLEKCVCNQQDEKKINSSIVFLNELYSWEKSAEKTLSTYKTLLC